MDIAIFNYPTGEVYVIRGVNEDIIEAQYEGDIEWYLSDCGYNTSDIHYMCSRHLTINEEILEVK